MWIKDLNSCLTRGGVTGERLDALSASEPDGAGLLSASAVKVAHTTRPDPAR